MKVCNKTHPELCYTEWDCPVCREKKERKSIEIQLDNYRIQCKKLEKEIAKLKIKNRCLPKTMSPEMMRKLLKGKFPTNGFSWDCVHYFKYEDDGVWEPYNGMNELLPAPGFRIEVKMNNY